MKERKLTLTEKLADAKTVIAKQELTINSSRDADARLRERFTLVLNSRSRLGGEYWGRVSEQKTLSWEEIFFQVGSISARLFDYDMRQSMKELEDRVSKLEIEHK